MTEPEFWEKLSTCKNFVEYSDSTYEGRKGLIRKRGTLVCPVCAVANKKLKKNKYIDNAGDAGTYLGLPDGFVSYIVDAADMWHDDECPHDKKLTQIRKKLKKVLKLK